MGTVDKMLTEWPDTNPFMDKIPEEWIEYIRQMDPEEFNREYFGDWTTEGTLECEEDERSLRSEDNETQKQYRGLLNFKGAE